MTVAQMDVFRDAMKVRPGHEWDAVRGAAVCAGPVAAAFLDAVPFAARAPERRHRAATFDIPASLRGACGSSEFHPGWVRRDPQRPRQGNNPVRWGASSLRHGRTWRSPPTSAAGSTGACCLVVEAAADVFRQRAHRLDFFNWSASPQGQHIELGIAEMNLSILPLGAWPCRTISARRAGCSPSARSTIRSSPAASMR